MSGGALDYFYLKLKQIASLIYQEKELSEFCIDLADVLHDLEWWMSGDILSKDFFKTWKRFKKKWLKEKN